MRPLLAKDIAPLTLILSKMELRETIKDLIGRASTLSKEEIGSELLWHVIENYPKVEIELFSFLADVEGKKAGEIADLPLSEFTSLLIELFNEKNLPFLKLV